MAGLKGPAFSLTAIITTMDNGGSSGRIRQELDIPAVGDLRKALIALANVDHVHEKLLEMMDHRFATSGDLEGHSIGNLILLAMTQMTGSLGSAISYLSEILGIDGKVVPVTVEPVQLQAKLEDGTILFGEDSIDQRGASNIKIQELFLSRSVPPTHGTLEAIERADLIILSCGDLYTSILPNLLVENVSAAIKKAQGKLMYVSNLSNKPGETDGFKLSDYLHTIHMYLDLNKKLDAVIINSHREPPFCPVDRKPHVSSLMELDIATCQNWTNLTLERTVVSPDNQERHDPTATRNAIIEAWQLCQE